MRFDCKVRDRGFTSLIRKLENAETELVTKPLLALENSADVIEKRMKKIIEQQVYSVYTPTDYKRSFALRDAATFNVKDNKAIAFMDGAWLETQESEYKKSKNIAPHDYHKEVEEGTSWFAGDHPWSGPRPYWTQIEYDVIATVYSIVRTAQKRVLAKLTRKGA